jgi:hypothetical protein
VEERTELPGLDRTEKILQRVVDAAEGTDAVKTAAGGIARSARWWLKKGRRAEASDLYSFAVAISAATATNDTSLISEDRRFTDFVQLLMLIDLHIRAEPDLEQDAFYDRLYRSLDDRQESLGATLKPIIRDVHSGVESTD